MFQQLINYSGWGKFSNQKYAEGMFTSFKIINEWALKKCAPLKTVFILND